MCNSISLSTAIEEFMIAKEAEGLSPKTLKDYGDTFKKALAFMPDDPNLEDIVPLRFQKLLISHDRLSKKSKRNMCIALSSLFSYHLLQGNAEENTMRKFKWPKPDQLSPDPLSDKEIAAIFQHTAVMEWFHPTYWKYYLSPARNVHRNRAIILLFLDTGIRVSELSGLTFDDLLPNSIKVFGKGRKERRIPLSEVTYQAIQIYCEKERPQKSKENSIFLSSKNKPLTNEAVYQSLIRIGKRANVHLHPHRFRHTFAINFLRNGGHIYALQKILGHTTLDMVKRYLKLAESDVTEIHKTASPVIHLKFNPLEEPTIES